MIINDAVNICLRYVGETPVPSGVDIDSLDPLHEAYIAREMLLQKSKELQLTGWWFNREEWVFLPDTNNRIGVPPTVLALETDSNVIKRGGGLYDRDNKTFEFEGSIQAVVIWEWEFADLPESFANWVTYETAQQIQVFLNGDDFTDSDLQKQIQRAMIKVQQEHIRASGYNLISGNRLVGRTSYPTPIT